MTLDDLFEDVYRLSFPAFLREHVGFLELDGHPTRLEIHGPLQRLPCADQVIALRTGPGEPQPAADIRGIGSGGHTEPPFGDVVAALVVGGDSGLLRCGTPSVCFVREAARDVAE